jgi:ubiquitin C-terminal hydrolase
VHWTEQHEAELNKRRKRKRNKPASTEEADILGHRPTDRDFECACDFNPLCLASLGGAMDEFLEKVAKRVQQDKDTTSMDSQSQTNEVTDLESVVSLASSIEIPKAKRAKPIPPIEFNYSSDEPSIVEPAKHRPSGVYQTEIPTEHMELDPEKENTVYSVITTEEMKQVRKTREINAEHVQAYVERTILSHLGNKPTLSYENYMVEPRKWHDSLSFSNPLLTTTPVNTTDNLTIAIPLGIKNLGATCYLNTHFQCLARMTAFLNGLFSWTPSGENHQMNSVLSTMQLLFARMVHGSEAVVMTQEFSDAHELENDEMQDPNEFARLLFERMHESFQRCSGQGEDLSQLLPKLFHGFTTYETSCLTCQNTTERSEGFMDLNLPIVDPGKDTKKTGQTKITDAFAGGAAGTNVQYCLNQYISAESLDGDNQYFCECCQTKRDALRNVKFTELPPLLNVQLSRFVFDRKKFAKKKLNEKVLLPRVLTVPIKGKSVHSKYILCAVMKHRETLAYQGHYIAEAMDWQSGTWFVFNDELVSVLDDGPSCSFCARGP